MCSVTYYNQRIKSNLNVTGDWDIDSLRTKRPRVPSPAWARNFLSVEIRPDWRCDPHSLLQWVPGNLPGVKRQGGGTDHPSPSSAEVKERVGLHLYSLSVP